MTYLFWILGLIEQAAARGPSVTFLRLAEDVVCDGNVLVQSHVGGVPYAESGDDWPQGTPEGDPAKFMLQVRIDHPGLGDQWEGRLSFPCTIALYPGTRCHPPIQSVIMS